MPRKTVFETDINGYPIKLIQERRKVFTVEYGADVRHSVDWKTAAHELGYSIFHALECESLIDRGNGQS